MAATQTTEGDKHLFGVALGNRAAADRLQGDAVRQGAVVTALTDNGGGATADGTIGAVTAPTAITDNTTGATTATFAAGAAVSTHHIHFRAAAITGNVLLYTHTPGYKFKILTISASVVDAITTGAKAATLTTAIGGVNLTGGIVIMSGTYALGAQQASSASITAANTGTAAQAITITASSVTAFVEGGFLIEMIIQNMDTADAIAGLVTAATAERTAIVALTDAVKELSTGVNNILTSLKNADVMASS